MDRREMLQKSVLLAGSVCLCRTAPADEVTESTCCITPVIEQECLSFTGDSVIVDLEKTSLLHKPGQAVYVDYPEKDVKMILVREKRNRYHALSRLCTHGGQALSYVPERKLLQCNSYNHSIFTLDGSLWKGPAPTGIRKFEVIGGNNSLEILI
jgi:nitrite reductase/ring-hydroxylating ferredoxin subunit